VRSHPLTDTLPCQSSTHIYAQKTHMHIKGPLNPLFINVLTVKIFSKMARVTGLEIKHIII